MDGRLSSGRWDIRLFRAVFEGLGYKISSPDTTMKSSSLGISLVANRVALSAVSSDVNPNRKGDVVWS